jgi:hypothetical protein
MLIYWFMFLFKNFYKHKLTEQRCFIVIFTYVHAVYFDQIHPVYITLSCPLLSLPF